MSYAANDTATCLSSCDPGWTTNGPVPSAVLSDEPIFDDLVPCVKCNVMCDSCEDDGNVGDKDRCKTCSKDYPFAYTAQAMCKKTCDYFLDPSKADPNTGKKPLRTGLFRVNWKTCGECSPICKDCEGDKFNCTLCDVAQKKALFQKRMVIGGKSVIQGTCHNRCPNTYFMDKTDANAWRCRECNSPCSACAGKADTCLACDGTENR